VTVLIQPGVGSRPRLLHLHMDRAPNGRSRPPQLLPGANQVHDRGLAYTCGFLFLVRNMLTRLSLLSLFLSLLSLSLSYLLPVFLSIRKCMPQHIYALYLSLPASLSSTHTCELSPPPSLPPSIHPSIPLSYVAVPTWHAQSPFPSPKFTGRKFFATRAIAPL
jgi:hypothetical protein